MSNRLFIGMILPSVGVAALALAGAASAQQGGGPPPVPQGGARSQDVAAANRQVDSDYNTLAGRGVEVIDKSRADSRQKSALVAPATAVDLTAGASVRDVSGTPVATIERLEADGAVVRAEDRLGKLPLQAFGKDEQGLLLGFTADQFKAAIAETSIPVPRELRIVDASPADMTPGATVRDSEGVAIGTVDALADDGVILLTGGKRVKLAIASFAKDDQGLLIGITASEFNAIIGGSAAASTGN